MTLRVDYATLGDIEDHADWCEAVLVANSNNCLTIPMPNSKVRSLNLATSVAIVLYEAIRQVAEARTQ